MEIVDLTESQRDLIERVDRLAVKIAPRAATQDTEARFPWDDIRDIHGEGWLLACLEKEYGGLGYGLYHDDPLCFYLMIERLAKVNPAAAHCFQVHNNALQMVTFFSNHAQRQRFIEPTREHGRLLCGAGSEPAIDSSRTPETADRVIRTTVRKVKGGFLINGQKHYVTNLPASEWIWVAGSMEGTDVMLMIHRDTPGLTIDESFWNPVGMRSCISPMLLLNDCFVPKDNLLGKPGDFMKTNWLAKINFGFTANYCGAMDGMYDWLVGYLRRKGRSRDTMRQVAMGELRSRIHGAKLLYYRAIHLFQIDENRSLRLGHEAKWLAIDTLQRLITLGPQAAGSTSLFHNYPLQRLVRDMQVHMLHSRHHVIAQTIGQAELGEPYNLNRAVG